MLERIGNLLLAVIAAILLAFGLGVGGWAASKEVQAAADALGDDIKALCYCRCGESSSHESTGASGLRNQTVTITTFVERQCAFC